MMDQTVNTYQAISARLGEAADTADGTASNSDGFSGEDIGTVVGAGASALDLLLNRIDDIFDRSGGGSAGGGGITAPATPSGGQQSQSSSNVPQTTSSWELTPALALGGLVVIGVLVAVLIVALRR